VAKENITIDAVGKFGVKIQGVEHWVNLGGNCGKSLGELKRGMTFDVLMDDRKKYINKFLSEIKSEQAGTAYATPVAETPKPAAKTWGRSPEEQERISRQWAYGAATNMAASVLPAHILKEEEALEKIKKFVEPLAEWFLSKAKETTNV